MRRAAAVIFWSVISAAFIGPGTVTTAARAGSDFGLELLWALAFSTLACWALQDAAARLTIASGHSLGAALRVGLLRGSRRAPAGAWLAVGAVVIGCAAYQAGNIVGAAAGAALLFDVDRRLLVLSIGGIAALVLMLGSPRSLAFGLGAVVALMGAAFAITALLARPDPASLALGLALPRVTEGAGTLVLGLIGTTVVPYNLFLGSGLAKGRPMGETRAALGVAICAGGLISMSVLVVGSSVGGTFSFEALSDGLERSLAPGAGSLFAFGLFAAGLSSAITAPLAAGLAVGSVVKPSRSSVTARLVSAGVLAFGLALGAAEIPPVPLIVLAQAANGLLLPLVAVFLLLAVNDRRLVGDRGLNGVVSNVAAGGAVYVALVIGVRSVLQSLSSAAGFARAPELPVLVAAIALGALLAAPVVRSARRRRGA